MRSIADGCAFGRTRIPDPYAAYDSLDGCIGKRNRLVTRLIQAARMRTARRLGCTVDQLHDVWK